MRKICKYDAPITMSRRDATHPCSLGPTLLASSAPTVWHCAQRVLKSDAPLLESPIAVCQHALLDSCARAGRVGHSPAEKPMMCERN
jgi:hypothetical protein